MILKLKVMEWLSSYILLWIFWPRKHTHEQFHRRIGRESQLQGGLHQAPVNVDRNRLVAGMLSIFAPNFYHLIPLIRFFFPPAPPPKIISFIPATLAEIYKLISASESKQCPLDSIPTFLLKLCFNELGPIITNLVNLSLSQGIFPSSFKQALVQPLLKKTSLSTDDLNDFRPISNLIFISKILEKVVASRIQISKTCLLTHCLLLFSLLHRIWSFYWKLLS